MVQQAFSTGVLMTHLRFLKTDARPITGKDIFQQLCGAIERAGLPWNRLVGYTMLDTAAVFV